MDYQASTSGRKIKRVIITTLRNAFLVCSLLITSVGLMYADDPTPNPLTVDIILNATVLQGPGGTPQPPRPSPPGPVPNINDAAIFQGIAYRGSVISVLKNGVVIASLPANPDGTFDLHVQNISPGTYSFGIRAEDKDHLTSKLLIFTVYVSSGIATTISGILIPPTITSDKVEVKKGEMITFTGSGASNSEIRLSFASKVELLRKTTVNASGTWSYNLDTSLLDLGDYDAKARLLRTDNLSLYSDPLPFRIGDTTRLRTKPSALSGFRKRCDLNDDNRVNLLDFSIMAFWYKRLGFPAKVDLNTDNNINLTDLSILAYCWTG